MVRTSKFIDCLLSTFWNWEEDKAEWVKAMEVQAKATRCCTGAPNYQEQQVKAPKAEFSIKRPLILPGELLTAMDAAVS